jgi:CDP-paratose 2-epimerase
MGRAIPLVFASTNKVYGNLLDARRDRGDGAATARAIPRSRAGGSARMPLDFCTPYGCSKGAADQYVQDYAKSFGLATAVMRMSCIYGPRQFGTEDQGWVAHFLIRALRGEPITVFGDGKQVRDVLHVNDAVAAYRLVSATSTRSRAGPSTSAAGRRTRSACVMVLDEIAAHGPAHRASRTRTGGPAISLFCRRYAGAGGATGWRARVA